MEENQVLRYSKQIILDGIGMDGQLKLKKSKVLVVGAGGLGSPVLYYLAASGVGNIGIVDFDTVGISNLNRQILHSAEDIGRKKTASAEEKLKKLNPEISIQQYDFRLNINNIEEVLIEYDVIVDATDNFAARYLISDCCYFLKKTLIEGAAVGFEGILMTIKPDETPCYRCLYPSPPVDGVLPSCSETGILGMVTGVIGSLEALEAVKVILNIGDTLSGRILTFDALNLNFRQIPWKKRESCPLCGNNKIITELSEEVIHCKRQGLSYE